MDVKNNQEPNQPSADDVQILNHFQPLFSDLLEEDEFYRKQPLLAHYTSIHSLEAILKNDEIWFSNPLLMNDLEEVRFGISEGVRFFFESSEIGDACKDIGRLNLLKHHLNSYGNIFLTEHLADSYIFCLSEHQKENQDGLLSMWRGYGGNGSGAAIVFDTSKIEVRRNTPLIIAKVHYGSKDDRLRWLKERTVQFAALLSAVNIPTDKLNLAAYSFFERLKLFAFFSKHHGFSEEKEWRIVYLRDRDRAKVFDDMFSYWIGPRGVEPKLKFKIAHIPGITAEDLSISKLCFRKLLGPAIQSPLARLSILRMLDRLGKQDLKDKVLASTIPFRAS
jgi:hypothetical protein